MKNLNVRYAQFLHEAHQWDEEHDDQLVQLLLQSGLTMNILRLSQEGFEWLQETSDGPKEAPGLQLWEMLPEDRRNEIGSEAQNIALYVQTTFAFLIAKAIEESGLPVEHFSRKPSELLFQELERNSQDHTNPITEGDCGYN